MLGSEIGREYCTVLTEIWTLVSRRTKRGEKVEKKKKKKDEKRK